MLHSEDNWQRVGETAGFNRFLAQIEEHKAEMGIDESEQEETCRYSPVARPHKAKVWADGSACDGNGYIYAPDGKSIYPTRCSCYRQWQTRDHIAEYLNHIPLDSRSIVRNANEGKYAAGVVMRMWTPATTKGIIVIGGSGQGKTIAGHRVVMHMIRHHQRGALYVSTRHVASDCLLLATDNDEKPKAEDRLTRVWAACTGDAIVFIDDLGRERLSDATVQRIAEYVDFLYERRAPVVFTSNYGSNHLTDRYGKDVVSRLMERTWLTPVVVDGHDVRMRPEPSQSKFQTEAELFANRGAETNVGANPSACGKR